MPNLALKKIRLTLARTKEFPEGSVLRGYEFKAPLDASGHIDAEAWKQSRHLCRVRRFWDGEEEVGLLVHRQGGGWAMVYDIANGDDPEAGYRFGAHAFLPGEYVSIRDEDGVLNTFVVGSVEPV
ncbi:MAG: hypothetical protein P4L98_15575 [Ancalomicrobiaceae bacterium]|nr:hypothetical protein [Ancalomicrobiaceae bacterium]